MTKCVPQKNHLRNSTLAALTACVLAAARASAGQEEQISVPSRPLDVHDCISLALNESPALAASRLDVASATEEARSARGQALPSITATAGYELFNGSPTGKFSVVDTGTGVGVSSTKVVDLGAVQVYSAHLSYPLFRDGNIFGLNTGPAEAAKLAKRRSLAWTAKIRREEVIARITEAYITTVSAENRTGYAARRVDLLEKQVGLIQEQVKQGLMLPLDLKLAQSQLSGARTLSVILEQQAVSGKIQLARALGFDSPGALHLSNELPEPPEPPDAKQLLGPLLAQHPSLQVQKALIDEAKEDYRLERFRLYPSVTLSGSALHIDDFSPSGSEVYIGSINVNVPIFDFGAQMSNARAELAKYQAERARLGAVADDVTSDIVKIFQSIYVLSQNILTLEYDVGKADREFQVIAAQQQQGISPPLTLIEKELHLISRKDELQGLMVRRLDLYTALQKATGGTWKWIQ